MYPMVRGRKDIEDLFAHLLSQGQGVELSVSHLGWIETEGVAIHHVEETVQKVPPGGNPPPPFYGTNIYRKEDQGWRLIVHQNAPKPEPPPPELEVPE
jgi:hypothetical protein